MACNYEETWFQLRNYIDFRAEKAKTNEARAALVDVLDRMTIAQTEMKQ
jgi:hypothetical protein